jgi:hypothetical protein
MILNFDDRLSIRGYFLKIMYLKIFNFLLIINILFIIRHYQFLTIPKAQDKNNY